MPFINKIEARAYSRATEISDRVIISIRSIFPENIRQNVSVSEEQVEGQSGDLRSIFPENIRQNVSVSEEQVEGQSGDSISIVSGLLTSRDDCETTFDYILKKLEKSDRSAIRRSLDLRLNRNCVFFLRIDKQGAFLWPMMLMS